MRRLPVFTSSQTVNFAATAFVFISLSCGSVFAEKKYQTQSKCLVQPLQKLAVDQMTIQPEIKNWSDLPTASLAALPARFRASLSQNPIALDLQRQHGRGGKLQFSIQHYESKIESGVLLPLSGLEVQAVFLKRLLRILFPDAKFNDRGSFGVKHQRDLKRTEIGLRIADSAEQGQFVDWRQAGSGNTSGGIEMSLLKSANPGPAVAAKARLRRSMNLPGEKKIVSLYVSTGTRTNELRASLKSLLSKSDADVFILTTARRDDADYFLSTIPGVHVYSSSKVPGNLHVITGKKVILNNSRGQMPAIHGASDATVVLGSPNLFESLNAGTPTVFFRNAEFDFDQKTWDAMVETARGTGGARGVNTMEEAADLLNSNLLRKPTLRPYEVHGVGNTSPLDRLMTNISNAIKNQ